MKNVKVKYSFAEWCKDNNHQDWLDLWDYELNEVEPEYVACGTHNKYWFKCARGLHDSEQRVVRLIVSGGNKTVLSKV